MNIALIKCGDTLPTDGIRLVSALLKKAGHTVYFIFIPEDRFHEHRETGFAPLGQILSLCDCALFSVYSMDSGLAAVLTGHIRRVFPSIKIIWGGPHCIAAPELSLRHADAVCFGEAEQCIGDYIACLEKGVEAPATGNMAYTLNGKIIQNDPLPPFMDLDSLPFYDYALEKQYILDKDLLPVTAEIFRTRFAGWPFGVPTLSVLTSRGCPHRCSYCNNSRYISLFGKNSIRKQSVGRFMDELESIVGRFGFFKGIFFGDDDFFVRSQSEIDEFSERYKRTIGLPFMICISAATFRPEKFEPLIACGLKKNSMGVQTVSPRVLKDIYHRNLDPQKAASIARSTARYHRSHGFDFHLDFIADNPYETRDEILANYRFMIRLPRHVLFHIHNLAFFPGTPIYHMAVKDGIIKPFDEKEFRSFNGVTKYQYHYEMFLFLIAGILGANKARHLIPLFLLEFLAWKPLRAVMNLLPGFFMRFLIRDATALLVKLINLPKRIVNKLQSLPG